MFCSFLFIKFFQYYSSLVFFFGSGISSCFLYLLGLWSMVSVHEVRLR